jgi:hypothetical protein
MTTTTHKKYIRPRTKIGLILTADERRLILDLVCLDRDYEKTVLHTAMDDPVLLTLDQWDDFDCSIAATANHTEDEQLQKKLDAIFDRIELLLETHTDEEPPLKIFSPAEENAVSALDPPAWIEAGEKKFLEELPALPLRPRELVAVVP